MARHSDGGTTATCAVGCDGRCAGSIVDAQCDNRPESRNVSARCEGCGGSQNEGRCPDDSGVDRVVGAVDVHELARFECHHATGQAHGACAVAGHLRRKREVVDSCNRAVSVDQSPSSGCECDARAKHKPRRVGRGGQLHKLTRICESAARNIVVGLRALYDRGPAKLGGIER